jgi:DNA polymerase V
VKAGIYLDDLCPRGAAPACLFERTHAYLISKTVFRYGRNTVFPAGMGTEQPWTLRAEHHSPRYTTRLSDVPAVRAR